MTRTRSIPLTLLALWLGALCGTAAHAEGSRDLYPSGAQGNRGNFEWRNSVYGSLLRRRTLLKVYARSGEYILVGSSAVGVAGTSNGAAGGTATGTTGDIYIYGPGAVTGSVGSESLPATPDFQASSQSGKGRITSRVLELAGPRSADGTANTSGWAPAYYQAPQTGVYSVVVFGPDGPNSNNDAAVTGSVDIGSSGDANTNNNFGPGQRSSATAWDVTVRASAASATDLDGRVFTRYMALFMGGNGRALDASVYAATTDGYLYRVALNGLDPNGFILYGNQIGFLDSDGVSPLYHDVIGADNQVNNPQGGCALSPPSYPIFLNSPDTDTLLAIGNATAPVAPSISALSFTGNGGSGGNNSRVGQGGTFSFVSNLSAVYDIVLSRNGVNFDPTLPANRRLRGVCPAGTTTVPWDGKDNAGADFPVGTGYAVRATIHAGEYHFPLLDAENSPQGGPSITLINGTNPLGNTTGFYDDRGYRTAGGTYVTSDGTAATVGQALPGNGPPPTLDSDPLAGYDTTTNQRRYGNGTNTGFGDTKGLDLWTYTPSSASGATLNVQGTPRVLLVKRITAVNGVAVSGFTNDPGTTDDDSPYWPAPASTYLRGALSGTRVQPGDIVEYTIYFVGTGGPATDFTLCDPVPANMTFQPDTDTGLTPGDGGAAGAPSGIALALSASTLPTAPTFFLTNGADGDRGQFYPPGTQAPPAANPPGYSQPLPAASNTGGVITVAVVSNPTALPSATGAGTPTGSYGFVRFCTKVN